MSILAQIKGLRTVTVMGLVFISSVLVAVGVIHTPIDAEAANLAASNIEAVANAADNLKDTEAVSAGVVAAVSLAGLVLRLFTTTAIGKK